MNEVTPLKKPHKGIDERYHEAQVEAAVAKARFWKALAALLGIAVLAAWSLLIAGWIVFLLEVTLGR